MSWLLDLFSPLILWLGSFLVQRKTLQFLGAGVTVADNPTTRSTDITIPGGYTPGSPLAGYALSLGSQAPPQFQLAVGTTVATTNAATVTIGTETIAQGTGGRLRAIVQGTIRGANPSSWVISTFEVCVFFGYPTGGALAIGTEAPVASGTNAIGPLFGGGSGQAEPSIAIVGGTFVLSATGPAAATAYSHGLVVVGLAPNATGVSVVSNGGSLYLVTTGGTTAGSGAGPTGTGGTIAEGGGSTVVYSYLGPASAGIVVNWTLCLAELASG